MEPLLISKKESAKVLGISIRSLENRIAFGELRARKIGRRVLIPRSELERFCRRDHSTTKPNSVEPMK